ncbi:MAG: carboxypeptidase regulatory-like domain-containing protein, partial [Dehalococcoidales bacterium]
DGAVYKKDNGIVIIDPEKAKGQKDIVDACPYGAIWWNEEQNVAQKCTLCAHLLDAGWKEPRCVQSCPTGALRAFRFEDSEMAQIIKDENLEVLHPEYNTKPYVYYRNLYRFFSCFVGGNVAVEKVGITDCADGARVTLFKDSQKIGEAVTDNYGDFKFDNLEENSGRYNLEVVYEGYDKKTLEVDLTTSKNVGTILL